MTALYEIATQYRADAEALVNLDIDQQTLTDTLDSLSGDLETKAQGLAYVARNLEALASSIADAEHDMAMRRKALAARAARLRDYMRHCMQLAGITKIDCPHFRISVRDNPPSVDVFDAAQVPAEYMRLPEPPPKVPDKAAIGKALKEGRDVPGSRLTQSQRVDIR